MMTLENLRPKVEVEMPRVYASHEKIAQFAEGSGLTLREIAEHFDVSINVASNVVRKFNVDTGHYKTKHNLEEIAQFAETSTLTNREIGEIFNCSAGTVTRAVQRHSEPKNRKKKFCDRTLAEFALANPDLSNYAVGVHFGCSASTVSLARKKYGIAGMWGKPKLFTEDKIEAMQADRDKGMTAADVAKKHGASESLVYKRTRARQRAKVV